MTYPPRKKRDCLKLIPKMLYWRFFWMPPLDCWRGCWYQEWERQVRSWR